MEGGADFLTAFVLTASVFALVYLNDRLCGVAANFTASSSSSGLGKIIILDLGYLCQS